MSVNVLLGVMTFQRTRRHLNLFILMLLFILYRLGFDCCLKSHGVPWLHHSGNVLTLSLALPYILLIISGSLPKDASKPTRLDFRRGSRVFSNSLKIDFKHFPPWYLLWRSSVTCNFNGLWCRTSVELGPLWRQIIVQLGFRLGRALWIACDFVLIQFYEWHVR